MRQVKRRVATVMPEIGFDDDPISPVMREDTVTKRNPKQTINIAPRKFIFRAGAIQMAHMRSKTPPMTKFMGRSRSVRGAEAFLASLVPFMLFRPAAKE
jgi:hypothetical protein